MAQADVSVVTSRCEAFGRVTVEAMLTGNLVLGADSAGTKRTFEKRKIRCAVSMRKSRKY